MYCATSFPHRAGAIIPFTEFSAMKTFPGVIISGASPALQRGVTHLTHAILYAERAPPDVALQLNFVSMARMKELNFFYRRRDAPTDVLTFSPTSDAGVAMNTLLFDDPSGVLDKASVAPVSSSSISSCLDMRDELVDLGEVFVSLQYMWIRCSVDRSGNLPFQNYLHAALIHAVLHALGYDHHHEAAMRRMVQREQHLCRQLASISRRHPSALPPIDVREEDLEYFRSKARRLK